MSILFKELNIDSSLIKALQQQDIDTPTEVQQRVIPEAMKNKDLIVQSETGTGKTLAYLLPLFEKIDTLNKEMQAIILAPTHELAMQIQRQIERLSMNSGVKVSSAPIIGNVNIDRQLEKLREKPNIIVGSAGRILELIKKRKISAHTIKTIILDEADRLVDDNNLENIKAIIKSTLKERQLMMFSATITKHAEDIGTDLMKNPIIIRGEKKLSVPPSINHIYFSAEERDKIEILRKLIRIINPEKAIVFTAKGDEAEIYASKLNYHGINAEVIHGSNIKLDRKKNIHNFRTGKVKILVASDIAARGLDIEGVTHIFNMNMPEKPENYLHRAGRTGRGGNKGLSISIVTKREMQFIAMCEKTLKISFTKKNMYKGAIVDTRDKNNT